MNNLTAAQKEYLLTSDSRGLKVLLHLLKIKGDDNHFYSTLDNIAADCEVTKATVNKVFQRLYKEGFLEKAGNGKYRMLKV